MEPRSSVVVQERRFGAEDAYHVLMGVDGPEVRRDPPDQPRGELVRRGDEVVVAKRRLLRRDPVAGRGDAGRALAGDPEHQVDDVDAAAEHHGVVLDAAAPAFRDLVQAAVEVIAVEGVELPEAASARLLAGEAVERRGAQDEVRGEDEARSLCERVRELARLGERSAQRLLHEDVLAVLERGQGLREVRVVVGRDRDDVELGRTQELLRVRCRRKPRPSHLLEPAGVEVAHRHDLAAIVGLEAGEVLLPDPEADHADLQRTHARCSSSTSSKP